MSYADYVWGRNKDVKDRCKSCGAKTFTCPTCGKTLEIAHRNYEPWAGDRICRNCDRKARKAGLALLQKMKKVRI